MICQGLNVAQKTQSGGLCSPDKQEFGHTPLGSQTAAAKGSEWQSEVPPWTGKT